MHEQRTTWYGENAPVQSNAIMHTLALTPWPLITQLYTDTEMLFRKDQSDCGPLWICVWINKIVECAPFRWRHCRCRYRRHTIDVHCRVHACRWTFVLQCVPCAASCGPFIFHFIWKKVSAKQCMPPNRWCIENSTHTHSATPLETKQQLGSRQSAAATTAKNTQQFIISWGTKSCIL